MVLTASVAPSAMLTASVAPGASVGILDESGSPLLDEAAGSILNEDGS